MGILRKLLGAFALLFVGATGLLYYVATPPWFTALPQQWQGVDLIGKTPEEVYSILGEPTGSELSVKMLEEWAISAEPYWALRIYCASVPPCIDCEGVERTLSARGISASRKYQRFGQWERDKYRPLEAYW